MQERATEQLEPAELVGLVARSAEGTAAKGMAIKGHEDLWVDIQANTFRNWVNEHLKQSERGRELGPVLDLADDFCDGTRLCALVETLTGKRLARWNPRPVNQHHYLENVSTALKAVEADGVKLVNIGNVDIVNGNLKLILGLIWSLIVRYQIGKSKFPPRKLMLSWLKGVLPECRVNNFTTDWNSGVYLSALLDYCRPGLFPHWRHLDPTDKVYNCKKAMEIAKKEFDIPMVLQPEYLASTYLDELSGMTYLSYFMKDGSPGFHSTLRWVNSQLPHHQVKNFTTDWNDGRALCSLVRALGGPAPAYDRIDTSSASWEHNCQQGIEGGRKLGVEPLLKAKDMADENVEHLGVMAYTAFFQWVRPRPQINEQVAVHIDSTSARVQQPAHFKLELLSKEVNTREVRGEVVCPSGHIECRLTWNGLHGKGTFVPSEVGMHKLMVYNDGELLNGCPYYFRVHPPLTKIKSPGMDPCAIGSIVEVLVNSYGTSQDGINVTAWSPTGRALSCPVRETDDGMHTATFQPDEIGEWSIAITHKGQHIQGGPFTCFVFDPHGVQLQDLDGAMPGQPFSFTVDATSTGGLGDIHIDIVHDKQSVKHRIEEVGHMRYRVSFVPRDAGKYRVYVYFNGSDVRGSPFPLRVGTQRGSRRSHLNSLERTSMSSLERSMNGLNTTDSPKSHNSPTYKSPSPSSYTSSYNKTFDRQQTRSSPINHHAPSPKTAQSPSFMNERKEMYSSSSINRAQSKSPTWPDPKDNFRSRSPSRSPMTYGTAGMHNSFSKNSSPKPGEQEYHGFNRRGSNENNIVDTTSNVKVSSMVGGSLRRDSWDAIAKTKSLLSYGSLESLANLTNNASSSIVENTKTKTVNNESSNISNNSYRNESQNYSSLKKFSSSEYTYSPKITSNDSFSNSRGILKNKSANNVSGIDAVDNTTMTTSTTIKEKEQYLNNESSSFLKSSTTTTSSDKLVSGSAIEMLAVHKPTSFTLDQSLDASKIAVIVTGPNGRPVPVQKSTLRGQTYTVTADQVGEHIIQILYNGQHIKGSPFRSQAYNSKAIQVGNIPNGVVNEPVEFEIDGSKAGSGNLEILVNGGHVTSFVRTLGNQRFLASFVPHEAVTHLVEMTFNGEVVPGSPWKVGIMPSPMLSVIGDSVRLVPAGTPAVFDLAAHGFTSSEVQVHIVTPSKRQISARVEDEPSRVGELKVTFTPHEVGSHLVEVSTAGQKLPSGPLIAKVYNSSLIQVTEVPSAVVGHMCQFRVDASAAGEGQLEISINEGEVPNHVQVVGGGRCLVSFTPEAAKPHYIDIKFNGEPVPGCPFVCLVSDTSRVSLNLAHLELLPVSEPASFHMAVDGSGSAELAVSVRSPTAELPVKVTGDIHTGFTAEFTPREVGVHAVSVEYNGHPVNGTPFLAKAFDASRVKIGPLGSRVAIGQPQVFSVDASQAGEGNLEITISARGQNIPTQVTPQGNARFSVGFVPYEASEYHINIAFNKRTVPGCPIVVRVASDAQVTVSGQALNTAPLGKLTSFNLSNVAGSLEDLEVNVEGPSGQAVPAQVTDNKDTTCSVSFTPRFVGEHRISVTHRNLPVLGSPFSCKVYDVAAIKVKDAKKGIIGVPVTFLVETSQAGPGNLEVTVNGGRVPTTAQAQGPHTYAIAFTPREPIAHTIDLRFNSEDVPGSPFTCLVNDTAKILFPENKVLEKVSVNTEAKFLVEAESTPTVDILAPTRESLPVEITEEAPGTYAVVFVPTDVGDHSIQAKLNGAHVQGSPFLVKAYNAGQVKVTDISTGIVGKPVAFSINASQAGAGNLEIIVAVNGKNVPNYVQSEGNAKFRVNFKPSEAALHTLSVRFNGVAVPGSPFTCEVYPNTQILVQGHNLKMAAVKQPISFVVDPQSPSAKCDVIVTPPSNIALPITIEPIDMKYKITFTPTEVGRHNISILVDEEPIKGSPFACNVYDVTKVHVSGLTEAILGQATTFTVDAAQAGEGTLELVVSTENNTVKAEVVACARGLYDVTFVPQTTSTHYVNISFNDDNVPGSPFKCPVVGSILEGPTMIRVGNTAYMDLDMPGLIGPVTAEVTGPDGIIIPSNLSKPDTNLHRVEIRTRQVGTYTVVFSQGAKIISSQSLHVFDPTKVIVQEVSNAVCHRPGTIVVIAPKEAGPGKVTAHVRSGGADVDSVVREKDNGICEIIFHPTRAAPHRVHIKYNDVHIQGSPLEVAVRGPTGGREFTATGLGLYQSCVGKVTKFAIETLGRPGKEFDVVISSPEGKAVPVRCYGTRDGNLMTDYTTETVGIHKIEVLHGTKPVLGSPFFSQAFDPSKVIIEEMGPTTISVHDQFAFKIIKEEAGVAELDVTATSPSGQELPLPVQSLNDGAAMIEFSPSLPGSYTINVSYGGQAVPDSPIICVAEASNQARARGQGLLQGHVDKPAYFVVQGSRSPPAVQVDGPDSVVKPTVEAGASPGTWNVSYVPTEAGVFDVRVVCAGQQLPGSPWHPKIIDTRNLRVIGGWSSLCDELGRLKLTPGTKVSFDTAEAGPGELTGSIDEQPLGFESTAANRTKLIMPQQLAPGEHKMEIMFNGVPFPGAPKLAIAPEIETPAEKDNTRVLLRGKGLTQAKCGEQTNFTIDGSQAGTGTPQVQIFSPTSEVDVVLTHLGNSVYRATYTPYTTDPLLMTASWNGRQVKGCPLQISVSSAADATRVVCSGQGLKYGVVGEEIKSFIDTRRAGPGELTAHCVGPHKVAYCELYDHGDATFTLNVKPQEAGRHALTIKYAGEHVPGSPFTLKVAGAPDATKVHVYGPGIQHGVLATYQSSFLCDTRGAGAGQLTVRVRGPKGAFRVEMHRESQRDRVILCRYDPTEPGDYRVEVRWAGVLVPGSPFPVKIVDTQDELLLLTQATDTCTTQHSAGHHTLPSWRGSQTIL